MILVPLFSLWGMFAGYTAPTVYFGSLLKSKWCKQCGQKNIQKKVMQTKINSYNNKYIKRKHYKTLRIF